MKRTSILSGKIDVSAMPPPGCGLCATKGTEKLRTRLNFKKLARSFCAIAASGILISSTISAVSQNVGPGNISASDKFFLDFYNSQIKETTINSLGDVPLDLATAALKTKCLSNDDAALARPVRIIKLGPGESGDVLVIFGCRDSLISPDQAFVYYKARSRKPENIKQVILPVFTTDGGISQAAGFGRLFWNSDTRVLSATSGSDIVFDCTLYSYRFGGPGHLFQEGITVLIKVEQFKNCYDSRKSKPIVLWEASALYRTP